MDFEQQLRTAFAPCDPRPALLSSILARRSATGAQLTETMLNRLGGKARRRIPGQIVVVGALLGVAAAAAMLGIHLAAPQGVAAHPGGRLPVGTEPALVMHPEDSRRFQETSSLRGDAAQPPGPPSPAAVAERYSGTFVVAVLPLREVSGNPDVKAAAEAYYSAVLAELEQVPGLALIPAPEASTAPADYRIDISSHAEDAHVLVPVIGDNLTFTGNSIVMPTQAGRWRSEIRVDIRRQGQQPREYATTTVGTLPGSCPSSSEFEVQEYGSEAVCPGPTTMAARSVDKLRKHVFHKSLDAASPGTEPTIVPLPFPPEFAPILSKELVARLHALFEQEPRDTDWASRTEQLWEGYFGRNSDLLEYGRPTAHCRASRCEIRLLAWGAPKMTPGHWFRLLFPLQGGGPPPGTYSRGLSYHEGESATAVVLQISYGRDSHASNASR